MTRKKNRKNDPVPSKLRLRQQDEVFDIVSEAEALNEYGKPPHPTDVVTPVRLFNWGSDRKAQQHANEGGISLLQVPANINMKGKKRNKEALLIYGPDRDHVMIFKAWIGAEAKCVHGSDDVGINRWRLLVGGKIAKKAQSYINSF